MKNKFCFKLFSRKGLKGRSVSAVMVGLAGMAAANMVSALGLGDITLNSTLDQPLDAEIRLLEVRDLSESEILVGLASSEAFNRQGVDRNFFLTSIKYDVVLDSGAPHVHLSSDRPVREPFLNFILEAQWPSGKLLREYTVLLDLPVFSDETAAPVSPVQTETVTQQQVVRQPSSRAPSSTRSSDDTQYNPRSSFDEGRQAKPQSSPSYSSTTSSPSTYEPSHTGDEYSVHRNDTLWEIALSVRPDRNVSVHQTMMALHRANPDAFINGNINLLKAGRVLRIPDADEIRSLNRQQAVREVAQHNAEWAGSEAAPLDASRSSYETKTDETYGEGRLSLASPDDSYGASEGRVSGGADSGSGDIDALSQELDATQETLDKTQGENQELRSKIGSLEDQIQTLESMLEVSNDSLRALELAAANDAADTEVEPELVSSDITEPEITAPDLDLSTDDAMADIDLDDADGTVSDLYSGEVDTAVDESLANLGDLDSDDDALEDSEDTLADVTDSKEVEPVVETPKPKVAKAPAPQPAQPGLLDLVMEYLPFIGLGVIALLAGIMFFIKSRNSSDDDGDFDAFFNTDLENVDEEDDFEPAELEELDDIEEPVFEQEEDVEIDPIEADSPEAETEDVVAESDIYIAYGKYDQAEEMLLKALSSDPAHHDARLKLLEVYAAQGNLESFDPNYATLRTNGAPDGLISRAASLRETIDGAGDFDESAHDTGEFVAVSSEEPEESDLDFGGEVDELSLDLESSESDSFDLELGGEEAAAEDEISLDLDLGESDSSLESDSGDIEFDLEGLDFADDESDVELETIGDSDETEVAPASGIDIEPSLDESFGSDLETNDSDIEFDLEGLDDLELGDAGEDIDLELDLGSSDASEERADASAGLEDELEIETEDSGDIEFDLADLSLESDSEAAEGDSATDFDLGDFELELADGDSSDDATVLDLDSGLDLDESLSLEGASTESAAEDTVIRDDAADEDDTQIREAPNLSGADELEPAPTQFDMAALDEELDAITSGLEGDLDVDAELGLETGGSLSDEPIQNGGLSLEDELESDLADLPDLDGGEAQAELDATIAEGEDILAELDVDEPDASAEDLAAPAIEEPDLDFGEVDSIVSPEAMDEPETGFEAPAADSSPADESPALDFELPEIDPDATDDGDLDFLSDSDETATKLDLASAYIDMGDMSGAKEIIEEVLKEGSAEQQTEAKGLLEKIGS